MIVEIAIAIATGVTTGVSSAWLVGRRIISSTSILAADVDIAEDADVYDEIDDKATAWAESTGRAGFAPFMAEKIRTVDQIHAGRKPTQRPRRWTRPW